MQFADIELCCQLPQLFNNEMGGGSVIRRATEAEVQSLAE